MQRRKREVLSEKEARRAFNMKIMLKVSRQSGHEAAAAMFPEIAADMDRWAKGIYPEHMGRLPEDRP
jgi:hypothetical protein